MTQEQLDTTVFAIENGSIEEYTYREFLREYGSDEITTPHGIAPRLFLKEKQIPCWLDWTGRSLTTEEFEEMNEEEKGLCYKEEKIIWELWSWGIGGNNPRRLNNTEYESKQEAELDLFDEWAWNVQKFDNTPLMTWTRGEAENFLSDLIEK